MIPNDLAAWRDYAFHNPMTRADEPMDRGWFRIFIERGRRWSAILTMNR